MTRVGKFADIFFFSNLQVWKCTKNYTKKFFKMFKNKWKFFMNLSKFFKFKSKFSKKFSKTKINVFHEFFEISKNQSFSRIFQNCSKKSNCSRIFRNFKKQKKIKAFEEFFEISKNQIKVLKEFF